MTIAINPESMDASSVLGVGTDSATRTGVLAVAGFASLGAGAVHAAAVGVHNEHPQAVKAFVVTALFQLAWGALAQRRSSRLFTAAGIVGNAALLVGWGMAKSSGIDFVDGLEAKEAIQFADGLAATLAAMAIIGAFASFLKPRSLTVRSTLGSLAALAIAGFTLPGMVSAGSHNHAHGADATESASHGDHGAPAIAGDDSTTTVHGHAADPTATTAVHSHVSDPAAVAEGEEASAADHGTAHAAAPAALPTQVYDPTKPLDFSGVEGVTPEQQAAAENLVAITLLRLPKFSDPAVAEALGWKSIGDGLTGHEHYINWDLINDNDFLNPDMPESLVYEVERGSGGGKKKLVSAMFMMPDDVGLTEVPNIGGGLMQWHIHDNLCFTTGDQPTVAGLTTATGGCPAGLQKFQPAPMVHVWITPHPCGPFAALEGVGAGTIAEGEERLCDHVHGGGAFGIEGA